MFLIDLNECAEGNGGCAQTCNNIVGSYYCSCLNGYELDEDGRGCSGTYAFDAKHHTVMSLSSIQITMSVLLTLTSVINIAIILTIPTIALVILGMYLRVMEELVQVFHG